MFNQSSPTAPSAPLKGLIPSALPPKHSLALPCATPCLPTHFPGSLETKSASSEPHTAPTTAPTKRDRRYRARRSLSDRVREALDILSDGFGEVLTHEETAWASITFNGTRHELTLDFKGVDACAQAERFIADLPEHEFRIPGHLVADAAIREVDHRFGADERMIVTAVLLLLEDV